MREVAVHLEHELRVRLERPGEAGEVGAPDALLRRPMEDVEPLELGREPVGDLAGAVGRAVVDHEHAVPRRVEHLTERPHERLDVLPLVVGRHADDGAGRHDGSLPAPPVGSPSL